MNFLKESGNTSWSEFFREKLGKAHEFSSILCEELFERQILLRQNVETFGIGAS